MLYAHNRPNQRLPKGENDVNIGSLLEDGSTLKSLDENGTGSLLSSLIAPNDRTPLEMLQTDFPSGSSGLFGQSKGGEQQMYVSEDEQNRQRTGSSSQLRVTGQANRGAPSNAQGGAQGNYDHAHQQGQQPHGQQNHRGNNGQQQAQQQAAQPQMPQMMPPMQYVPIDPNTGAPIAGAQAQGGYFLQQPMFIDQNGQPVFYRVPQGQFPQEMMYAPGPDGASPEQMMAFLPYHPNGQQFWMNPHGPMPDQNGPPGSPMYVNPNGQMPAGNRGPYGNQHGNGQGFGQMGPGSHGPGGRGGSHSHHSNHSNGYGNGRGDPIDQMGIFSGNSPTNPHGRNNKDRNGFSGNGSPRQDRSGRGSPREGNGGNYPRPSTGAVNPTRDPLVDEFRTTYGKTRQWELIDLIGHVVAFCQDQHGSRFIQQRLEVCTEVDKQLIFDEIAPSAHSLMTDVFGNYVLQKLFEYGTPEQCETLAALLTGQAVMLSMQMYGCRVVQKALEYVNTQRLVAIVTEFENPQVLLRCVHDSNGNHVIQKCIEIVSKAAREAATPDMSEFLSSRIMFIINAFQGRVKELSSHPYGCRVVQRILEHCSNPQKALVLEELRKCCAELVQDCYGNYVIQFVMQHGWDADRAVLVKEVQAHLLDFSQHKFASNVVEKCLQYANKRDRDEMIWAIINVTFDLNNPVDANTGHCVLESMVRDPYANYVVQKVIDVSDDRQRAAIVRYVKENIVQLRRYTYGKHIIVRLEKITNEKF
jgi:hypothetical protein